MSIHIAELCFTDHAVRMLTLRGISIAEVQELRANHYRTSRNQRIMVQQQRRTLIGHTHGGRPVTVVIEEMRDPACWLVITGWKSSIKERKLAWR